MTTCPTCHIRAPFHLAGCSDDAAVRQRAWWDENAKAQRVADAISADESGLERVSRAPYEVTDESRFPEEES